MGRRRLSFILITFLVIILAACGSSGAPTSTPLPDHEGDFLEEDSSEDSEDIDAPEIYSARCARCHGIDRSGKNGPALLPARLTQDPSVYETTINNGSGPMPAFGSRLSADEISALVEFILSEPQ